MRIHVLSTEADKSVNTFCFELLGAKAIAHEKYICCHPHGTTVTSFFGRVLEGMNVAEFTLAGRQSQIVRFICLRQAS